MISRELVRQYKPKLLPDFVAGKLSEEELYVRPLEFYKEHGIKLRLGQEVVDVDFAARQVRCKCGMAVRVPAATVEKPDGDQDRGKGKSLLFLQGEILSQRQCLILVNAFALTIFGLASGALGIVKVSRPSSKEASALSASTPSGISTERERAP